MIRFINVSKKYPNRQVALDDINFNIVDGEFVFLVGPSGAGKTTILKLIIGDLKPSHGSIHVDDFIVNKITVAQIPFLRRKVGFVFQDFKLLGDRTVGENLAVALEIFGKSKEEMDKKIKETLELVNLKEKRNLFPKQLSYGEQQRVSIGRAVIGEARFILADEPTGNLDPRTSWEILKILTKINQNGKTIIMATHNVDIVNSMKKRVIVLQDGKIVKDRVSSGYS